ncbi:MAG TPA: hypothetical protein VG960_10560 [Caulobacteraceae bacterium]|nr:hypothetical protein [Caulobacteraceae bacterium]
MSLLTREFLLKHTRARVLASFAGHHMSDFERDLIEQIGRRREAFGAAAQATEAEQAVVLDALTGMETGLRRAFSENREAFAEMLTRAEPIVGLTP